VDVLNDVAVQNASKMNKEQPMCKARFASLLVAAAFLIPAVSWGMAPCRFADVTSLEEVSAGDDYDETQPAVEHPRLLRRSKVAILAVPGTMEVELTYQYKYLKDRGAKVDILGPEWSSERALLVKFLRPSKWVNVDRTFADAMKVPYDLIIIPGGAWGVQILKTNADALALIKAQHASGGSLRGSVQV
jgi:hypothetical protein